MRTPEHVYRIVDVEKITDGDTYWLRLDVGFRQTQLTEIRLDGYDCPETRQGSPYEREQGRIAADAAADFFVRWRDTPDAVLWVQTQKDPDSFGRWLGAVWAETPDGGCYWLGNQLATEALATLWPVRWHEVYDPQRNRQE